MEPLQVAEEVVESSPNKLEDVYRLLADGSFPSSFCSIKKKNLKRFARKFILEGGCLYYVGLKNKEKREVVVDPERRHHIFLESHISESGHHLGQKKTVNRIQSKYYWLGVVKDVIDWIKVCETCQNAEYHRYPCKKLKPLKVEYPWEALGVTLHGPFPTSSQNNTYVMMLTDFFTKWTEGHAIPRNDAESVAKALSSFFFRFGGSRTIYCNQSWDFCEQVSRLLSERWQISQTLTVGDSCEHFGLDDHSYELLKSSVRRLVNDHGKNWDKHLDPIFYHFRTTVNPVTKYTPYFLMFNRNARPFDKDNEMEKEDISGCTIVPPTEENLVRYISTEQEQKEKVRLMVLDNLAAAEKPMKKTVKKCQRSPASAAFHREEEVFGVTEQTFKKLKTDHVVSFKFQTVFSPDVAVVDKDN